MSQNGYPMTADDDAALAALRESIEFAMLRQPQHEASRSELRLLAGWLSALVGNLAFHLGDYPAAAIHFSTAARERRSDAIALAHHVLDTLAPPALRETLRGRLRDLDRDLFSAADPGSEAGELRERLHTLPHLSAADRASDEPNGR